MLTLKFIGHFSGVSRTFWEEYVRPESMSVVTLGVYCTKVFPCNGATFATFCFFPLLFFVVGWTQILKNVGITQKKDVTRMVQSLSVCVNQINKMSK